MQTIRKQTAQTVIKKCKSSLVERPPSAALRFSAAENNDTDLVRYE